MSGRMTVYKYNYICLNRKTQRVLGIDCSIPLKNLKLILNTLSNIIVLNLC